MLALINRLLGGSKNVEGSVEQAVAAGVKLDYA